MPNLNFVVKNGLVVNGSFTANSTVVNAAAISATSVNAASVNTATANATTSLVVGANVTINTSTIFVGNNSVNTNTTAGSLIINGGNFSANSTVVNAASIAASSITVNNAVVMGSSFLRNRIINGDMRIDQRNSGFGGTATGYTVDRWIYNATQASKGTWQQNAGGNPPVAVAGFTNYLGFTSSSSYSVSSTDAFGLQQYIEGYNISDLSWGTASALSVTLSFWVISSLTGTFGGALKYYGVNISYPFSYTISLTNVWTKISIVVPGYTATALPSTTNGGALVVNFSLGAGSTQSGTAGAWVASGLQSSTGAVSVVGTNGATFYVTGVQLEVGSVATAFERRQFGTELALCQRYYVQTMAHGQTPAAGFIIIPVYFPVEMRVIPTSSNISAGSTGGGTSSIVVSPRDKKSANFQFAGAVASAFIIDRIDAYSAEL